ncbi:Mrp/NBP35 family ATP-binding protein [Reichenbachiella agariperforans]|uniref:Mrp/NBP35 family ATP-binding protein n=1 Tax=Reichenbachiella agariperforans TaxID=156994 RepID=UPI001C09FB25|nr:Mrp/NBP35 family ATP-binding protein [Reichenbachiella agariperforans]MBU2916289.1 Mrp/NBP35 family ATP-binding protein [Reichenbachiella agariperforans]
MKVTDKDVLKALGTVQDPDLKQDLVTLNMIKGIEISDTTISFTVELTTPACPLKEKIKNDCLAALEPIANGLEIKIEMSAQVTSTRGQSFTLPNVKNIIAVSSGKGGVGKSTVTANLAVALAKSGAEVGIIDADIFGPSIPTMFNCEYEQPEMVKEGDRNLIIPITQYGVKLVSIGFLTPKDNAIVWRGPMASSALKQFISDVKWGDLDYLLIDLPPGTSDIHLTLVQSVPVTGALIVTTPQKVAIADAKKGLSMFKLPQINVPVLGVIENMAYFTPEELPDNKYYLFGENGGRTLAEKEEVPFLGQIPIVQSIRESGDSGFPAVMKDGITEDAFMELSQSVARQIAIRNATQDKTNVVQMS